MLAIGVLASLRRYRLSLDTTASLAVVGAMLVYPLAWFQYDACLLPAIGWGDGAYNRDRKSIRHLGVNSRLIAANDSKIMPTQNGEGFVEIVARNKNWIQVIARGILFGVVVAVAPRATNEDKTKLNSTCGFGQNAAR